MPESPLPEVTVCCEPCHYRHGHEVALAVLQRVLVDGVLMADAPNPPRLEQKSILRDDHHRPMACQAAANLRPKRRDVQQRRGFEFACRRCSNKPQGKLWHLYRDAERALAESRDVIYR